MTPQASDLGSKLEQAEKRAFEGGARLPASSLTRTAEEKLQNMTQVLSEYEMMKRVRALCVETSLTPLEL